MKKNEKDGILNMNNNNLSDQYDLNEEILRAVISVLPGTLNVIDKEYNIIKINDADFRLKLTPYRKADELKGEKCYEVFMNQETPCSWCRIQEALKLGEAIEEYTDPLDPREIRTGKALKIIIQPIKNKKGEVIGAVEYGVDVTELRERENLLNKSKRMYQDLAEQAPIGIISCDLKGIISFVNSRAIELMKSLSIENIMGDNILTLPILKDIGISDKIERCMKENVSEIFDLYYISKFRKEIWIKIVTKPLVLNGKVNGARIVLDDVTELIERKKRFRENEEHFNFILEHLADAVWIIDRDGIIRNANKKATEDSLYSKEELIGMNIENLDPTLKPGCFPNIFDQIIQDGYIHYLGKHVRKDKMIIDIEAHATTLDIEGEILDVCTTRDITEQKRKEDLIRDLSYKDHLTGLYNRRYLEEYLEKEDGILPTSLLMIDVNGLKMTNDAFGHFVGDELLKCVAASLKDVSPKDAVISRVGGDEFVVIIPNCSYDHAENIVNNLYKEIENKKVNDVLVSISIGWETRVSVNMTMREVFIKAENHMFRKKLVESQSMRHQTIKAILKTLNEKNEREKHHSDQVSVFSKKIGEAMGFSHDKVKEIEIAGLLHDIGKIAVREDLLNKTEKLTAEEYNEIKKHSQSGYQILKSVDEYSFFADYILAHHEKYDGSGYPRGLKGEEIPLIGRIIAIADAYEAMISDRPYRKGMSKEIALLELKRCSGSQFDPKIIEVFISLYG